MKKEPEDSFELGIGGDIAEDGDQFKVSLEDRPVVPEYTDMTDWAADGNKILIHIKGRESEMCALKFYSGDWWNRGVEKFGEESCLQALSENQWARTTILKIARIARLVPPEVRNEKAISFETHGVIAKPEMTPDEQEKLLDRAAEDGLNLHEFRELVNGPKPDPQLSSNSYEYGTPAEVLVCTRMLFGGQIDLDPASSELFQQVVQAKEFFTEDDGGLSKPWAGKVFCNPPYGKDEKGRSRSGLWADYLLDQHENGEVTDAILLVNSATGDKWFQPLFEYMICFPRRRLEFYTDKGEAEQPTRSNAIIYMGAKVDEFVNIFSEIGSVLYIMQPDGKSSY